MHRASWRHEACCMPHSALAGMEPGRINGHPDSLHDGVHWLCVTGVRSDDK